ncbi:MAG: 4Fe-4S dicluster domain-containing protein [Chloroflexi bacterium]|nr:4Fe-4S dicluster domain-containing protein [Chloroflexota bacterium]
MVVKIDRKKCSWCGWCVNFCPRGALKSWVGIEVDTERCTDCYEGMHHFDANEPLANRQQALDRAQSSWRRACMENCPCDAIVPQS